MRDASATVNLDHARSIAGIPNVRVTKSHFIRRGVTTSRIARAIFGKLVRIAVEFSKSTTQHSIYR